MPNREPYRWGGLSTKYPILFNCWRAMIYRCTSKKHPYYKDWGGRGIRVCERWIDNFPAFVRWALENGWKPGLEIDRINNNGHYRPSNCRWVTEKVQRRNQRPAVQTLQGAMNIKHGVAASNKERWRNPVGRQVMMDALAAGRKTRWGS